MAHDAELKRLRGIVFPDGDGFLQDNFAAVGDFVDEMDGCGATGGTGL